MIVKLLNLPYKKSQSLNFSVLNGCAIFLPFQCRTSFSMADYRKFEVMRFAVEEINNSSTLLPNVSIGYKIFDICYYIQNLPSYLDFISLNGQIKVEPNSKDYRHNVIGLVGPYGSEEALAVAPLFMMDLIPMLLQNVKRSNFTLQNRDIEYDMNGDPPASLSVVLWRPHKTPFFQIVGTYDTHPVQFTLNSYLIPWYQNGTVPFSNCSVECDTGSARVQQSIQKCCFQCKKCEANTYINTTVDRYTCVPCKEGEWSEEQSTFCRTRSVVYLQYRDPLCVLFLLSSGSFIVLSIGVIILFAYNYNTPVVSLLFFKIASSASDFSLQGDYLLGGLFSLNILRPKRQVYPVALACQRYAFDKSSYHMLQVMRFAVAEINNSSTLLPSVSLGYEIFDHCSNTQNFPSVFTFISENGSVPVYRHLNNHQPKIIAVIGPYESTRTITVAPFFMLDLIPMSTQQHMLYTKFYTVVQMAATGAYLFTPSCILSDVLQLLKEMKTLDFSLNGQQVKYDINGDPCVSYGVVLWRTEANPPFIEMIGVYNTYPKITFTINTTLIKWVNDISAPFGKCSAECTEGYHREKDHTQACCFQCKICPSDTYINVT
ncbi:hypothetical protein P4O66_017361, partial [Electrophorus voltai]